MHSELPLPSTQFAHHAETLARVRAHFAAQPDVSAVLLGGSIAHGFASVQSDVDIAIVVPDEQFQDRLRRADTCFFSRLPLLRTAVSKLSLFGGRLILAHNQLLYPYHKWFLRVLERAPQKPPELLPLMQELARDPQPDTATRFVELLRAIGTWPTSSWGPQFMIDSELSWLHGNSPIDDL
ncbi:MAG: hypothetical protein RL685_5181 [Pseudomonadota bacterium]|jgi:hypothetical protein